MSTVTVRELHRSTAAVLARAEKEGGVIIRRRNGTQLRLLADPPAPAKQKPEWPDFAARRARISPPIHPDICAAVDKMIRGE